MHGFHDAPFSSLERAATTNACVLHIWFDDAGVFANDEDAGIFAERESSLNLRRRTVNLRRPKRTCNEGTAICNVRVFIALRVGDFGS